MRRSGKTTRIVDRCIQELFKNKKTFLYEGRGTEQETNMTKEAMYRFKKRMKSEHSGIKYTENFAIIDGIKCFEITLN